MPLVFQQHINGAGATQEGCELLSYGWEGEGSLSKRGLFSLLLCTFSTGAGAPCVSIFLARQREKLTDFVLKP